MKQRFYALDGLRGVAAFSVVCLHAQKLTKTHFFLRGNLSVDVFFILSGFVLAYAFSARLEQGMGAQAFLYERIRRLGPVLWLSAALSFVSACIMYAELGPLSAGDIATFFVGAIQNGLLLPNFVQHGANAFPLNFPLWSLFAELWINVGFAVVSTKLTTRRLLILLVVEWAIFLAYALTRNTVVFGTAASDIQWSIVRAAPSFSMGILLYRLWKSGVLAKLPSVNPLWPCMVWFAISFTSRPNFIADVVLVLIGAPLLVALLARYDGSEQHWMKWVGKISYPLYATHLLVLDIFIAGFSAHDSAPAWAVVTSVLIAIMLADSISRWFEPAAANWWDKVVAPRFKKPLAA